MKRLQLVSSGALQRILDSAELAKRRRNFRQSRELLQRAARLSPGNASILFSLAHANGRCFDYGAANDCLERALRILGSDGRGYLRAAMVARDVGDIEAAENYLRNAKSMGETSWEVFTNLADIYERQNRADDAIENVKLGSRLNPSAPEPLLSLARLHRNSGRFNEALLILNPLIDSPNLHIRCRSLYEMGNLMDREGRYDEAMSAFNNAKRLLLQEAAHANRERLIMRRKLQVLFDEIDGTVLAKWADDLKVCNQTRKIAFLCGHPRSGTTLLEQVLDSHPDAISAEETDIFHDEAYLPLNEKLLLDESILTILKAVPIEAIAESRRRYFRAVDCFLKEPVAGRLLIDKNPSLTFLIPAIFRVFPEARFLIAIRDPRDVCLSCFMQPFVPVGPTTSAYLSLETTIEEYVGMMSMYLKLSKEISGACLEVKYEEMVDDLESIARKATRFLDLDWVSSVLQFHTHAQNKVVRSPTYADVKQPVFSRARGRWKNYIKYLEPHLEKLHPLARALGYD